MQLGSMFICNCNIAVHVSDAFCVHLQEHLETLEAHCGCHRPWTPCWIPHPVSCHSPEAATTVFKGSWRWTQKASETCRAILQLQINILPSCITLVLFIYILVTLFNENCKLWKEKYRNERYFPAKQKSVPRDSNINEIDLTVSQQVVVSPRVQVSELRTHFTGAKICWFLFATW